MEIVPIYYRLQHKASTTIYYPDAGALESYVVEKDSPLTLLITTPFLLVGAKIYARLPYIVTSGYLEASLLRLTSAESASIDNTVSTASLAGLDVDPISAARYMVLKTIASIKVVPPEAVVGARTSESTWMPPGAGYGIPFRPNNTLQVRTAYSYGMRASDVPTVTGTKTSQAVVDLILYTIPGWEA